MPADSDELKVRLLETDEEYRGLATQHRELEERLKDLTSRPRLSEPEQVEEITLKKRKLQLKDRMEDILRRRRDLPPPSLAPSAPSPQPRG